MEIEVKGHSGCQIDIVREGQDLFIFKSTKDKKYLPRLLKQAEKQHEASLLEYQHIRVPNIFNIATDDTSVTIKMEYVYSKNFIEYFESAGFEQIKYFIKALELFVDKEIQHSKLRNVDGKIVKDKFNDVKTKILSNPLLKGDDDILEFIEKSSVLFNNKDEYVLPVGICHGDLTFSNVLFNGNNYYLIDFLDSFIESPLLDMVKIRQDSAHLWSQLMYTKPYDKLRLQIICEKIDKEIDCYFGQYKWYCEYYNIFQLMNMLRILQYAQENKVVTYLKKEIKELLHEF